MEIYKTESFNHNGKDYEIRVLFSKQIINSAAFFNNYPANGLRHQIQIPQNTDPLKILNEEITGELIELVKEDIIKNRWDKIEKVFK